MKELMQVTVSKTGIVYCELDKVQDFAGKILAIESDRSVSTFPIAEPGKETLGPVAYVGDPDLLVYHNGETDLTIAQARALQYGENRAQEARIKMQYKLEKTLRLMGGCRLNVSVQAAAKTLAETALAEAEVLSQVTAKTKPNGDPSSDKTYQSKCCAAPWRYNGESSVANPEFICCNCREVCDLESVPQAAAEPEKPKLKRGAAK